MITYIDKELAEKYTVLSEAANIIGVSIDQLDTATYLNNIGKLAAQSTKYVRVPVDEDVFEIDADARTITVPKTSFAKNGVGVVGDELAEILYFKMARFFDIADLGSSDMEIYIQWENASGEQGVSKAYAKDVESDKDKVYFGWALSSAITAKAGNIKFNVRVVKKGTVIENGVSVPAILYSFSTQTATVAIKSALNLDLLSDSLYVDNADELVKERLMDGKVAAAAKIVANLPASATVGDELKLELDAIDSNSKVAYKWYKDGELYTKDSKGENVEYYKPTLTVTETGDYYVTVLVASEIVDTIAKDETGADFNLAYHTSVAATTSATCVVPAATKLTILGDLNESAKINDELKLTVSSTTGTVVGKVYKTDSAKLGQNLANVEYKLVATITGTGSEDSNGTVSDTIIKNAEGEEISAKVISYTPTEAGYYKVVAENTLNGSSVPSDDSTVCRVTAEPTVGDITITPKNGKVGRELTAKVNLIENSDDCDTLSYQWCKLVVEYDENEETVINTVDTKIEGATKNTYTPTEAGLYHVEVTNTLNGMSATADSDSKQVND